MRAGDLQERIVLQSPVETNDSGSLKLTYSTVATVWAQVITQKGFKALESFENARETARDTIRVGIRYRDDVTDKWRLTWAGNTYGVVNTDRSGRRDGELWLTARSVGAE